MTKSRFIPLIATVSLVASSVIQAASFEKPIMWSGKHAGFGGAASSFVKGAEALYFNPAGLATNKSQWDLTLDFSPTLITVKTPVVSSNTQTSGSAFAPFGGLFASYKVSDSFGVGMGVYASGGSGMDYGDVDFGFANKQETSALIGAYEFSLGVGYALTPNWSLGAAWRGVMLSGELKQGSAAGTGTEITGLSGSDFTGVRAGLQYENDDKSWGFGATFRTAMKWDLTKGKMSVKNLASGAEVFSATDAVYKDLTLPMQILLGFHTNLGEDWMLALQYDFANYAVNKQATFGSAAAPVVASVNSTNTNSVRIGAQYGKVSPWRFGYAITSPSTPANRGVNFGPAPTAYSHNIVLGKGFQFSDTLSLDTAFEVMFSNGTGVADSTNGGSQAPNLAGEFKQSFYALHTGLKWLL